MSVTALKVPKSVASVTVSPPAVRLMPLLFFSCTVRVEVVTPSATIEAGAAVISDVVASATLGVKVTVALSVIATAFTVPVIVAVPVMVVDVSVAV